MIDSIDVTLRLLTIGQMLLIATALVIRQPGDRMTPLLLILMVCTTAYLLLSGPPAIAPDHAIIRAVLFGLAPTVPFAVWAVILTAFDDDFRGGRPVLLGLLAIVVILSVVLPSLPADLGLPAATILRLCGLMALGHAIFRTQVGRRNDLMERRRRWRTVAVALIAVQVTSVLIVELAITSPTALAILTPVNAGAILAITTLFGAAFLKVDIAAPEVSATARPLVSSGGTGSDDQTAIRLRNLIDAGGLFESGLTIAALAAQIHVPEHRLRAHINRDLGFRNFNAFLNEHRIRAARQRLTDPAMARTPVLTIAMDLGYGSLGPFNRAFKAETGATPSAYRRENSADS